MTRNAVSNLLESLASPNVSAEELRRCAEILDALVEDRGLLAQLSKEERKKLLTAAGRVSRPERDEERRLRRTFKKVHKHQKRSADRAANAKTGIRVARDAAVFVAPQLEATARPEHAYRELKKPKNCYVCKQEYTRLHFFYDLMCPECAEFNYAKRYQTARLDGWVALITGSRLKIGYHAALKMLRAGARVIATTRFPHDSAARYAREPDFAEWRERLHVHGLDLRHSPSVEIFTRYLNARYERLDILINNAAQTVRRPVGFYQHLLEFENRKWSDLPDDVRPLLA
ncbi:MAG TPA: SDR family NAD(P)-dependent oxidoreductase, partial [Planctomycetota bacterium]|nr:SDR family NAD(P)-dependent oxidoreductase [Planctomycetota bacterium]